MGWPEAYNFILRCVSLTPDADGKYHRPSATTLLQDPFLNTTEAEAESSNQDVLEIALKDNPDELARRATSVRTLVLTPCCFVVSGTGSGSMHSNTWCSLSLAERVCRQCAQMRGMVC